MITGLTLVACGNSKPKVEEPSQETVDEPFDKSINQTEADDRIMVSFDTCGGNQIAPQEIDENGIVEKVYPQRDDYVFMGWYLDKKYRQKFDFNTIVDRNLTLFAKWSNQLNEIYDFQFTGNNLNGFSITAYYGEADKIILPDTYHDLPVVAIDANVFNGNDDLCELTISEGIKNIGSGAFKDCLKLNDLQILGAVHCSDSVFDNCRNLQSIFLAGKLTTYSQSTEIFYDAGVDGSGIVLIIKNGVYLPSGVLSPNKLQNSYLNLPKITEIKILGETFYAFTEDTLPYVRSINVTNSAIGGNAFKSYINLQSIMISNNVVTIGNNAFQNCPVSVHNIQIPNSIKTIGSLAFAYCENLTSIIIPSSVESIGKCAFKNCKAQVSANLDNVTEIGSEAFSNCNLTSITISSNVKSIGYGAFGNCTNLESMNYLGTLIDWLQISFGSPNANPVYYTNKLVINGEEITDMIIPDNIEQISLYAFYCCESLNSVIIPKSVKIIHSQAFAGCYKTMFYCERSEPVFQDEYTLETGNDEYFWNKDWRGSGVIDSSNGQVTYPSKNIVWNYVEQ